MYSNHLDVSTIIKKEDIAHVQQRGLPKVRIAGIVPMPCESLEGRPVLGQLWVVHIPILD
jgi:hypothetical protein